MSDTSDRMLAKIRAMLAKAEATEFPAEAEAFTAKAVELMAAYGIDQAMLVATDPTRAATPDDRIIIVEAPFARDKAYLLAQIGLAIGCKVVTRSVFGGHSVHLIGYGADLDRTDLLFTSLLVQAPAAMARTPVPYGEHVAAWKRSWLAGYTATISRRLWAAERRAAEQTDARRREASTGGPSTALVLADRRSAVDKALADLYPTTRTARRRTLSGSGQYEGVEAGWRADLGGARVGQASRDRALPGGGAR